MATKRIIDLPTTSDIAADDYLMLDGSTNATRKYSIKTITDAIDAIESGTGLDDGSVGTSALADNAVTSAKLADNAVATADIQDGAVTLAKIASGSEATSSASGLMSSTDKTKLDGFSSASDYALKSEIIGAYIYKGSVTTEDLLPTTGVVVGDVYNIVAASSYGAAGSNVAWNGTAWDALGETFEIGDGTIVEVKIANGAVTTAKIADNGVTTAKILDENVTEAKLANGAVTTDKLGDQSVTDDKIADGNVTTLKMANQSVTEAKLADGAVVEGKIANGAVTTAKIADGSVATNKIAIAAVTKEKLAEDVTDEFDALYNGIDMLRHDIRTAEVEGGIAVTENAAKAVPIDLTVYGVSEQDGTPTPDAPVNIMSAENPVLTVAGKNLCGGSALLANMHTAMPSATTGSDTDGNYIRFTGADATVEGKTIASGMFKAATQYTIIVKYLHGSSAKVTQMRVKYTDGTTTAIEGSASATAAQTVAFVTEANKTVQALLVKWVTGTTTVYYDQCGIFEGVHTTSDFEPYVGVAATLPVTLRSLPDGTKDQLDLTYDRPSNRKGWAWYEPTLTRYVGHVADMGELAWTMNAQNGYFTSRIADMNQTTVTRLEGLLCTSYGMSSTSGLTQTSPEDKTMLRYGGSVVIRDSSQSTAADFKAACAGQMLLYELATPTTETLPDMELPILPLKETTVYCTSGSLQPEWHMTYQIDADAELVEVQERVDILEYKTDHMWGNRLTGELTGNPVTASDAYTTPPLEVEVDGKSEQTSYTGKNLFDKDGDNYGYWSVTGGGTFIETTENRYFRIPVAEGDVLRMASSNPNAVGATVMGFANGEPTGSLTGTATGNKTVTIPAGVDEVSGSFGTAAWPTAIVTLNNADITYEPYTGGKPSPSPDYPQEIRSVVDPVVTFAGKNLLDYNYSFDETPISGTNYWQYYVLDLPNGTYTMSCNYGTGAGVAPYGFFIANSGVSESTWACYNNHPVTITVRDGLTPCIARRYRGGAYIPTKALHENGTIELQLELGPTATDYEPYVGVAATLPVTIRSLPDGTKDTLALTYLRPSTREGWAWYAGSVTRRVLYHELPTDDGNWSLESRGYFQHSRGTVPTYIGWSATKRCNAQVPSKVSSSATYVYLVSDEVALEDFIAAMGGNPLVLLTLADAPTTETLPEIELPVLPAPNVTVWATADATPTLQVTYERDVNITIAALEEALADVVTS